VERGEITYHFQPIVTFAPARRRRVEMLLRWLDEDGRHILTPPEVIHEAGVLGELARITEHGLATAIATAARLGDTDVSMNFTAREIESVDLVARIIRLTEEHDVPPDHIVIEVTEDEIIASDVAVDSLRRVRDLGVRVALDDFGTGFTNFSYLLDLPVDELKLDRSFLRGDGSTCERRRAVMASVIDLAHALGLSTTVEGVEVSDHLGLCSALHSDRVQGYHLNRPVPATEIGAALRQASDRAEIVEAGPIR